MKSIIGFVILFIGISVNSFAQSDIMDGLYGNFKSGNSKEIAKSFSSSVEFILIDEEDVYSKAQAEQILKDFFVKNPPKAFTKVHSVGSSKVNYRYGVIVLTTKTGKFRISITLNKASSNFLITELRIEHEK